MANTAQKFYRSLNILEETTWGTAGTVGYVMRCMEIAPREEQRLIPNPIIKGDRKSGEPFQDVAAFGFTARVPLFTADETGWWINHAIGEIATTGSPTYTHTAKVGFDAAGEDDLLPGFSADFGYVDLDTPQYALMVGCRVNELTIPFGPAGPAEWNIVAIGKTAAYTGSPKDAAPTAYTSSPLSHTDITAMTEGGGASTIVLGGEIHLNNNLDAGLYTVNNSGQLGSLPSGQATVDGRLQVLFQTTTELNKAINKTESSLGVTWTQGATSLALTVPELYYHQSAPVPGDGSAMILDLEYVAFEGNHADATLLKAVLTNTTSTY